PRMRAVWNSARMQRNRSRFNPLSRSEISADVKQNFVSLDVVVNPRNFHGLGMGIEQTRRERANNITADLEGLMDWRRLMHRACDRFEIPCVKCEGVEIAVPANDIERMMRHGHLRPARSVFHENLNVAFLVDRIDVRWAVKVTLGIRCAHFDLALVIQI